MVLDLAEAEGIAKHQHRDYLGRKCATHRDRVESDLAGMKEEPEIHLESTRHYVMDDPEDTDSVYDTFDVLGPWDSLNPKEKLSALHELDWSGVGDEEKRQIIERDVDLSQVSDDDRKRYFGDVLDQPKAAYDPVEYARPASKQAKDKGKER
jgi:hypothetical protein